MQGSAEFMSAYHAAINSINTEDKSRKYQRTAKGSFGYVCLAYYASVAFRGLDPSTQSWRRRALDLICKDHADKPVGLMQSKHVRRLVNEIAERPVVANTRLLALRALFREAVKNDEAPNNPARDVELIEYSSEGHHSWTLDEVKQFEKRHPIGTKARLAMTLMLFTAGRREDAVRLGPQHIRDGRLRYTQSKNEHRKPVSLNIPVRPELGEVIAATPSSGHLTFLIGERGRPFTPKGFGGKFRKWCDEAGLPQCSAHGLRKATAAYLAECGCTPHEIMSITGHRSLKEVERYTRAATQAALADSAMAKFKK